MITTKMEVLAVLLRFFSGAVGIDPVAMKKENKFIKNLQQEENDYKQTCKPSTTKCNGVKRLRMFPESNKK